MNGEFDVSQSMQTEQELIELLKALHRQGSGKVAAKAAKWIVEELARTPMEFGESRHHLPHLDLFLRIGFVDPWAVVYAVNVPNRKVFIRRWRLQRPSAD